MPSRISSANTRVEFVVINEPAVDILVDIIVPTYNSPEWVRPCLRSIARNTANPYRLVVVDDGSDNYTRSLLRELVVEHKSALLLFNEKNLGFVKSCNIGMSQSHSPYLVLLNTDALVPPGWLDRLLHCVKSDSRIGIASPLSNEAANISVPLAPGCNYFGMAEALAQAGNPKYPDIVTAVGFCMMLRKEMLDEIGLFDEIYDKGYCEETDLCLCAMKAGWRVVACDDLYVFHKGVGSFTDSDERYRKNLRIFLKRHGNLYRTSYAQFTRAAPLKELLGLVSEPQPPTWYPRLSTVRTVLRDLWGGHPFRALRHFKEGQSTEQLHKDAQRYERFWRSNRPTVTFLFDSLANYGGVISTLRLVNGLIERGFEVRIASLMGGQGLFKGLYTHPLYFGSLDNLIAGLPASDLFISTVWSTADWLPRIRRRFPQARYLSYIQDYESWFQPSLSMDSYRVIQSYNLPDAIVTTSTWLNSKLRDHGKDSVIIPKGVDRDTFRVLQDKSRKPMSVLAMARPHTAYRGFPNIVKVFRILARRNPDMKLGFFGCNDKTLGRLDFSACNFGVVENGTPLAHIYNQHAVYLDASKFQGFGMMGLEAMACGCAVVLTKVGGINEYAKDQYNSLLISPDDLEAIATAIQELLENELLRANLVEKGLQTADTFSLEREINTFSHFLEQQCTLARLNPSR